MELVCCRNFPLLSCTVFISSLFVLDGASPPAAGPCSPNPCRNRALCRSHGDGYSCFCVPGFQGSRCQIDVNECVSQPCRNGATCVDRVGRFSCLCASGFTGATCEVHIDECQSQPCLSGASCHDHAGGFTCTCPPGFQGHRCEIDTDECREQRCQNGAPCVDGVNEYSCDCSHTAFTGRHCEVPLPPCRSEPCLNGATCQDDRGNYTCKCWPGFEGRQCELDVSECASSPCLHGGRCVERSWQAAYGSEPLLPERYDHRRAAGFVCSCPPGTAGSLCQEVMNPCDPGPCLNGGRCESHAGGYSCHCLQQSPGGILYGGVNCDVRLVGCEGHECQDPGSCSPFLLDGTHGYTCSCSAGFTGPLCKTPTTFSFERRGYLLLQSPLVDEEISCNVTLSFKTVLPRAVLFQRNSGGLLLSLELEGGQLRLTLRKEASAENPIQVLDIMHNVTDGEWHSVEAVLANWVLSLKLLGDAGRCGSQACHRAALVQSSLAGPVPPPQNTFIGGVLQDSGAPSNPPLPAFIGCMRDVFVDWQLVVPGDWRRDSAVNVSPGCSHRDRCLDVPCQGRGQCVNLWQSYQCLCSRPYEGQDCAEEHVIARFGGEDSHSFAAFTVTEDLGQNLSISLFVRTRRPGELLLALANGGAPYLRVWLEDGRVAVQLGHGEPLRAEGAADDGEVHFVSVEVREGRAELYVAGQKQGGAEAGGVHVQAGDTVFVGGLTEARSTSAHGGYFKGCIQDLRISDRRLQFFGLDMSVKSFPLQLMENVTAGCSGDNACTTNPCLNGGLCYSMWDDFTCTCPPSTAGRRCEEVWWCELAPCPADAECRTLSQGYECFANATFLNNGTVLSYRGNGRVTRNLTSLSLSLRTRKRNAALLHAEDGAAFVTLSVQDGFLFLELQGGAAAEGGAAATVSLSSRRVVSDGEWHSAQMFMAAPWMQSSQWTLVLDEEIEEASTSKGHGGSLDFLREGVDILVGGLAPDSSWALAGCLSTVELGGVALSYFRASEVNFPRLQEEQFTQTSARAALAGCGGAPVCEPNPCLNGGECQDLFNAHNCTCAEGWAGRRCDFLINTCASNPCAHGNCSVRGRGYECACESGYAGPDCEEEVDMCEGHRCAHGGTCLHGPDRYACLCPDNYTGPLCSERVEEIPWYIVVRNVRPRLPVSVCGDDTRNYTCFNGGNCTDRELSCDCPPGFTGHRCEQEVDECRSNPCLNGGYCRNLVNKFVCVCEMSFAGDTCQTDVSDIYFYVAILLWQNLFQLLSYLIVRLDDQPEMKRAPRGSQLAAVLAPCLLGAALAALALGAGALRGKRQTEGGLSLRRLEAAGGHDPPAEPGDGTPAEGAERLLTSAGLTSDLLLSLSLVSVVLLALVAASVGLVVALNRRATRGAYSPSRQEKEGSRVEMWSITQPPPVERLI